LESDLPWLEGLVPAKRPVRLPVVLTREEVRPALHHLDGVPRFMAFLPYRPGVQDLDFASREIVVRGGKGDKDRVTMLPGTVKADLSRHLEDIRAQDQRDLAAGAGSSHRPPSGKTPPEPAPWTTLSAHRIYLE